MYWGYIGIMEKAAPEEAQGGRDPDGLRGFRDAQPAMERKTIEGLVQ